MKLTTKLTMLFLLLSILPLAVVGYLAYENGRRAIEQNAINRLTSITILKADELNRWVENNKRQLRLLAREPLVRESAAALAAGDPADPAYQAAHVSIRQHHLDPAIAEKGGFLELFILRPGDGLILVSTDGKQEGKYRESEPYFVQGKTHTYVQNVYYSLSREEPTMTIGTPITDEDDDPSTGSGQALIAVLAGHLDLAEMSEIMLQVSELSPTQESYLVNKFNFFVTESRFQPGYALKTALHTEGVTACLQHNDGVGFYENYRGVPVIGAYRWMPERELCILTEVDQSEAFAPIVALRNNVIGIGAAVALIVTLLSLFFTRTITGPVSQLVRGTEEIGRGNLDYRIAVASRDEIGQLAGAFNAMAATRKRAEERLHLQSAALRSAANAIVIADRDGTIHWVNPAFTALTGYTAHQAIGQNPRILKSGEHDQAFYQNLWDTILAGQVWHGEMINRRKDGTHYTEEQIITPVRDQDGKMSHFIAIKQDITERKRVEERLAKITGCLLGFAPDPRENINRLTALCGELMGAACALYNRLDQGMLCSWGQWNTPPDYNPVDQPDGHICYDVIKQGGDQVFVVRNLPETPYAQTDPNVVPYHLQTYVGLPVKFGGAYVGSLCVVYQDDFVPGEEDKRLMQIIALAIGVEERRYHAEESLRRRDTILEAVSFAAGRFLQATSWEETIQEVLERLGQATAASRVYIFENHTAGDGTLLTSQRYEWTAPGITPQIDHPDLQDFPAVAGGFARWVEVLGQDELIHGHVRDFPESEQEVLAAQDIQSIVVVPIFVSQAWWGFIGFDECLAQREWSAAEMDALKTAADTLGAAIQRQQAEEKYCSIFENAVVGIYQTTLEGEWLTANPALARTLGYGSPEELMEDMADLDRQFYVEPDRRAEFMRLVQAQGNVSDFESQVYRKDSSVIWVSENARAVRDASGRLVGFEGTTVDITDRKEAQETQRRLAAVIETTSDFVGFADLDGRPLYLNKGGRQMLGIGEDEDILNIKFAESHPEWARELVLNEGIPTALREGIWRSETALLARDGRELPVLQVIVAPRGPEGSVDFHATIMRDITERKQAEERTRSQLQRLAALREIDMAITASMDLHVTLNVLLDQVTAQLGVDAAAVLLLDPHTLTLEFAAGRGFRTAILQHTRLELGEGYAGQAALERRTIVISDLRLQIADWERKQSEISNLSAVLAQAGLQSAIQHEGFVAYYGVPLVAKAEVKGVLEIFHRAPLDPGPEWLDFLEALATQAAIAIDNAELFDDLQRSHAELTLAYDTTLEGWARALELRDMETEGHSRRVTEMTLRLARAMGMRDEQLVHVRRGALLHDIGKIGVPDSILFKPDELTDAEWDVIRQHPVYAYQMLAPIDYLRPALDIPYCHHERWDGSGYPRGLQGEQIPLPARIFAVVDVYDALTSDRPYRDAWSEEEALAHIQGEAGQHFDPQVVEVFMQAMSGS